MESSWWWINSVCSKRGPKIVFFIEERTKDGVIKLINVLIFLPKKKCTDLSKIWDIQVFIRYESNFFFFKADNKIKSVDFKFREMMFWDQFF